MPCFKPLSAFRHRYAEPGRPRVSFSGKDRDSQEAGDWIDLPCGQCIGCRLERSRRWAVRLMHESKLHERNSFLTLTYDEKHLPSDGSLQVEHFQKFMKRLRRGSCGPLRFFHCGEYGETNGRPHYHCILFGEDFGADRRLEKRTERGDPLYESPRLSEVWGMGHAWIGELTFESAAYVARYCLKKVTGDAAEAHYAGKRPEYVTMSRRPGIGAGWFDKFSSDVYPSDEVIVRGRAQLPPPFYDKLLERADPLLFARIKRERVRAAGELKWSDETRTPRLLVREEVKLQTIKQTLGRKL